MLKMPMGLGPAPIVAVLLLTFSEPFIRLIVAAPPPATIPLFAVTFALATLSVPDEPPPCASSKLLFTRSDPPLAITVPEPEPVTVNPIFKVLTSIEPALKVKVPMFAPTPDEPLPTYIRSTKASTVPELKSFVPKPVELPTLTASAIAHVPTLLASPLVPRKYAVGDPKAPLKRINAPAALPRPTVIESTKKAFVWPSTSVLAGPAIGLPDSPANVALSPTSICGDAEPALNVIVFVLASN